MMELRQAKHSIRQRTWSAKPLNWNISSYIIIVSFQAHAIQLFSEFHGQIVLTLDYICVCYIGIKERMNIVHFVVLTGKEK